MQLKAEHIFLLALEGLLLLILTEVRLDFELSVGSDNLFPGNCSKDLYEIWHEVRHW